ncbi:type II restriction endonuclease [Mycobacteroides abscessus]|uniref:type II restriction endonuclease n=1 Tax=Mycobacteroides abscessus TaxID=36809 RepID=UPI000944E45F|nr:type II restriction endonuclease [Mycobacteroides abscessus]
MGKPVAVEDWLRAQCSTYDFGIGGVYRLQGEHKWPLVAKDETDLQEQLEVGGHILPLPKEPAALANVLEVGIVSFLVDLVEKLDGATAIRGTERGYPDLELSGPAFGGGFHAVDIKVARRAVRTNGQPLDRTQSRITLYTGNTYFRHPKISFPGAMRPFADYATHLDVLGIYTLNENTPGRVDDLELIVQEPWKIASKKRSSTTREYIGAVEKIEDLRAGNGEFDTPEAFYTFWRKFPFKTARAVELLLAKQLDK